MEEKRVPNFTTAEKNFLLKLIADKYAHILEDKKTNRVSVDERNNAWKNIENEFNATGPVTVYRQANSLKRLYENKKKDLRKRLAEEKKFRLLTGGGPEPVVVKKTEDDLLISILNEKTLIGLTNEFDNDASNEVIVTDDTPNMEFTLAENNTTMHENSIEDVTEPSKFIPQQNNSQKRVCIDQGLKMDDRGNTWKKMKTSNLKLPLSSALTSANSSSNSKGDETNNENELPSLPKNRRRPTTRITTLTSSDVAHKYNIILDRRLVLLEKQRLQIEEQVAYDREERKLKLEQLKLDVVYKKELLKQNFNLHL